MTAVALQQSLTEARAGGRKLLVPYITGGVRDDWLDIVRAVTLAGADAIEIGIPFSDPVMDGPVIQQASVDALRRGRHRARSSTMPVHSASTFRSPS